MNQNLFDAIKRYAGEKSSFIPIAMFLSGLSAVCSMFPYLYIYYETSAKLIVQNLLISSYFCTFIV